jgi:hypothetical protein
MYVFINALILALLVPGSGVERVEDGPACRAELKGLDLVTIVDLPSGLRVEGPWRVVHTGDMTEGETHYVMFATLDRVIERDPITGVRSITPFPEPVSLAFEGTSQTELVQRAAQVWCVTVMRAQENQALDKVTPQKASDTRVAALTGTGPLA